MDKQELRKAAIVLASLDRDTAVEICRQMSEVEAEVVLTAMARLGTVPPEEQQEVLLSFRQRLEGASHLAGAELAEELMTAVLGPRQQKSRDPRQQSALERLRSLSGMDPRALHRMLSGETPQMIALVLGQLPAERAAQALMAWPEEDRADLALRVAKQGQLAPGTVEAVGEALGQNLYRGDEGGRKDAGIGFVVKLLEDMDRSASKELLDRLRASDESLADQVASQLFTFDNVVQLPDRDLQLVLRGLDHGVIARALKGMDEEIKQRIVTNLSERAQEIVGQEMELLGPVLVSDVEAAQREFVKKALESEEAGELTLSSGAGEYIE